MTALGADVAALRASWQTVRGGWAAAVDDARQLIVRRRVLVQTKAGQQLVLCTRLRLIGDTQTDVSRAWYESASAADFQQTAQAHFTAVDAAMQGWNVARALGSMLMLLTRTLAAAIILIGELVRLRGTPPSQLLPLLLENPALWLGAALWLVGEMARFILRWRLRALFARG
jgi:hypothetical protein